MTMATFRYRRPVALGDLVAAAAERAFILAEIDRMATALPPAQAAAFRALHGRIAAHRHYPPERGDHHV